MSAVKTSSYIIFLYYTTNNTPIEKILSNANNIIYGVITCIFYFLLKYFCFKSFIR